MHSQSTDEPQAWLWKNLTKHALSFQIHYLLSTKKQLWTKGIELTQAPPVKYTYQGGLQLMKSMSFIKEIQSQASVGGRLCLCQKPPICIL